MSKRVEILINRERCKSCEYCRSVCPKQIIQMSEDFNSQGYHYAIVINANDCTGCRFCAIMCPEISIELEVVDHRRTEK